MTHLNVEIKARCLNPVVIREYLLANGAEFRGTDLQTDTYFNSTKGRLKLREGNIENNLIFYERTDQAGPKASHFHLVKIPDANGLKEALAKSIGIKVIVEKKREIYYIRNVKFHLDELESLGSFVEIEAGNINATNLTQADLKEQCDFYLEAFGIQETDLLDRSYSEMLLES